MDLIAQSVQIVIGFKTKHNLNASRFKADNRNNAIHGVSIILYVFCSYDNDLFIYFRQFKQYDLSQKNSKRIHRIYRNNIVTYSKLANN